MTRRLLPALLVALAVGVALPSGAQARVACDGEGLAPSAANLAQVSAAVFCLTNQVRASYGLPALRRDARLDTAALLHSEDMAARSFFAHETPEGRTPTDRAAAQGYPTGVGENIAMGYATPRAVMIGWMASTGHCQNVLGIARDIGVGTANPGRPYYTQDFGDYAFGTSNAVAAGCPYKLDLDTLVVPEVLAALTRSPASSTAVQDQPAPAPPATLPASAPRGLRISSARLRPGGRAIVSFTLSSPATVMLRIQRRAGSGYRTLSGAITATGRQGSNRITIRARLRGRSLAAGRYRLRAVATDAAGHASPARHASFRVVRGASG